MRYLGGITADESKLDMAGQSTEVFKKMAGLMESAESSKGALLSVQIFLTDMSGKEAMNGVWVEWLDGDDLPARASIGGIFGSGDRREMAQPAGLRRVEVRAHRSPSSTVSRMFDGKCSASMQVATVRPCSLCDFGSRQRTI